MAWNLFTGVRFEEAGATDSREERAPEAQGETFQMLAQVSWGGGTDKHRDLQHTLPPLSLSFSFLTFIIRGFDF